MVPLGTHVKGALDPIAPYVLFSEQVQAQATKKVYLVGGTKTYLCPSENIDIFFAAPPASLRDGV